MSDGTAHLVVPGQIIATSQGNPDQSFLRGHGTYVEVSPNDPQETKLVASVCGIVQRVNQLITVQAIAPSRYEGNVGDLVVGRVLQVQANRWKIQLTPHGLSASLPLSGVHLPGGQQRIRTSEDAREMRNFLQEGDLICAEVHKVQQEGGLGLHTRSVRYGKLENGTLVIVPPKLIPRRKNHYIASFVNKFDVLLGCNGNIWIQRRMDPIEMSDQGGSAAGGPALVELYEARRQHHSTTPMKKQELEDLARLRNVFNCLEQVQCQILTEDLETIYHDSLSMTVSEMLLPHNVLKLTEKSRKRLV